MSKVERIKILKEIQSLYSKALAEHATLREPTIFQQFLQDRLFAGFGRVTAELAALL